jgi:two-component system chemotaxis response regulator CheY
LNIGVPAARGRLGAAASADNGVGRAGAGGFDGCRLFHADPRGGRLQHDDAGDGSAALAKMRDRRYGLIISDWNMEPMTGYDLLKQVRADPKLRTTPFIMVTAESKTENVIAAKRAGVNNYIVKPFNADTLRYKINAVFAN